MVIRFALAVVVLAGCVAGLLAPAGPVRANEVPLSAVCGNGVGGTFVGPYWTAYTGSTDCASKYLVCTYYVGGSPYYCPSPAWSAYLIEVDVYPAGSITGQHKVCNDTQTICSLLKSTSDS